MPTLESLGIDKLSTEERLALADAIYESVSPEHDGQTQPTLTPEMLEKLRDRVRHADRNPQLRISADAFLAKLEAKHEA
ncbi:MAG: addiction module protein [Fimbriiglobus sp.]